MSQRAEAIKQANAVMRSFIGKTMWLVKQLPEMIILCNQLFFADVYQIGMLKLSYKKLLGIEIFISLCYKMPLLIISHLYITFNLQNKLKKLASSQQKHKFCHVKIIWVRGIFRTCRSKIRLHILCRVIFNYTDKFDYGSSWTRMTGLICP